MQLFYIDNLSSDIVQLPPDEARHCVRSLRMSIGDTIHLTDGHGTAAQGTILSTGSNNCTIQINSRDYSKKRANYRLHIAIAPTKNTDRIEWFVEKAVEIGIDEISILLTHNTERPRINLARLHKIAVSAMKQSLHNHLPIINPPTDFRSLINNTSSNNRIICHGHYSQPLSLLQACPPTSNTLLLIGPEGDFTDDEISLANQAGFLPVTLGPSRLRTETAALYAVANISLINLPNTNPSL